MTMVPGALEAMADTAADIMAVVIAAATYITAEEPRQAPLITAGVLVLDG